MSDKIMEGESTETDAVLEDKSQEKTFTAQQVEQIVRGRLAKETRKFEAKFGDIDIDQAKEALREREEAALKAQKERGEFETILKETVSKKDAEINSYKAKLHTTLVDTALLSAANQNGAINANQVAELLKNNVRLSDDGSVEIMDGGAPRYNDKGDPLTVNEAVQEFLTVNPHFVRATSGGSGSLGNAGGSTQKQPTVAEMNENWNTWGRDAYAKLKRSKSGR